MIQTGHYRIRSKATNTPVGRHFVEDLSLMPKRVLVLPNDTPHGPQPWIIIKEDDDTYTLRAGGAPVANINGQLFANLLDQAIGQKAWKIEAQPQHGENTFTIVSAHEQHLGWVVPNEEPYTQLDVRPLISTKSLPPQFPSNQLFEIVPLLED
ncbi:proteinase inhibitor [Coprinellus micaceus]|uniref:Proteinase inhibitor n=1 Tax=Coprinellus micaceus TaxID=71717 RepID=A0A4Y7SK90_COPMI|nr:proteinase inhibitor [Coprinellus micaceus]